MTDTKVNVLIKARSDAKKAFDSTNKSVNKLSSSLKTAAKAAAAFLGARALFRFGKESAELFGIQENAVNNLRASLELLGPVTKETVSDFEVWASEIQKVTTIGDEAVLEIASLGASMAKLSGQSLKDATVAAIGLSKSLKIDVKTAMVLVGKAAVGNTSTFSRYGITLDATKTKQEQFQSVLDRGIKDFALARAETETFDGKMKQLGNTWGDIKEQIGSAIAGPLTSLGEVLKGISKETVSAVGNTLKWVAAIGTAIIIAPKIIKAIQLIIKTIKAWRNAQVALLAVAGPAGWATLAVGVGIAAGTILSLNALFDETEKEGKDLVVQAEQIAGSMDGITISTNTATVATNAYNDAVKNSQIDFYNQQAKTQQELIDNAKNSIISQTKAIGVQNLIFGKTEKQALLLKAKMLGLDQTTQDYIFNITSAKEKLVQQAKTNDLVADSVENLREKIRTIGKSPDEILLAKLTTEGANPQQVQQVKDLMNQLNAVKGAADIKGTQQLSIQESRFLTLAPGAKVDPVQKNTEDMAKSIKELVALQKQSNDIMDKQQIERQELRVGGGPMPLGLGNA